MHTYILTCKHTRQVDVGFHIYIHAYLNTYIHNSLTWHFMYDKPHLLSLKKNFVCATQQQSLQQSVQMYITNVYNKCILTYIHVFCMSFPKRFTRAFRVG